MDVLAIIPARGGSKGIPRKNVAMLAGKPLIAHTIGRALAAQKVTRVVVSTDDAEIAQVSHAHGAEVVMRPVELAGDTSRSEDALFHVLDHLAASESYAPDLTVFLQCTSPLTTSEDIDGTIDRLIGEGADTAHSVVPFHYFLWRHGQNGADGVNHDKSFRLMRQQREPEYLETGSVYVMRTQGFLAERFRFFGRTAMHVIPFDHWQEIDEPLDFQIAEERMNRLRRQQQSGALPTPLRALVMDFDGVHTDDKVLVTTGAEEAVVCSRADGMGIELLRKAGLAMTVISKERNAVVAARCEKLRVDCTHGVDDKLPLMRKWLQNRGIALAETVYVGNDVNDLTCMAAAGCAVAPADAHPAALAEANLVLTCRGGQGALRELADMILQAGVLPASRE
jgi:N-acylneuraminate cytidylyltransferase